MPNAPPRRCQRCHGVQGRDCKCTKRDDTSRADSTQRGYDRKWRKFRQHYMAENPICIDCERVGKVKGAEHIHHIEKLADRPDLKYEWSNLMALCERCHNIRTAKGE